VARILLDKTEKELKEFMSEYEDELRVLANDYAEFITEEAKKLGYHIEKDGEDYVSGEFDLMAFIVAVAYFVTASKIGGVSDAYTVVVVNAITEMALKSIRVETINNDEVIV